MAGVGHATIIIETPSHSNMTRADSMGGKAMPRAKLGDPSPTSHDYLLSLQT